MIFRGGAFQYASYFHLKRGSHGSVLKCVQSVTLKGVNKVTARGSDVRAALPPLAPPQ